MKTSEIKRDMPGLYNSWRGMRERCRSTSRADSHCYALKGISVCQEWESAAAFVEWALANGYRPGLTIDRIDGNVGYSPGNCRWADRKTQGRNISRNRVIEAFGMSHCLSEWAEKTGIRASNILARIDRLKWPAEMALSVVAGSIPPGPKARK